MFNIANKQLWLNEFKATFMLGWPLIMVQLLSSSIGVTDVVMMGWLGPEFLAAGGTASSYYFTFVVFGMGTVSAVAPLVAQAIGAKDDVMVRRSLRQGVWVALFLAAIIVVFLLNSETMFLFFNQKPQSVKLAVSYLDTASWSVFPMFIMVAFRAFLGGQNDTKVILYITIIGFLLNLIGNYTLMFGNFGAPRLELAGAGISTSIVQLISTLLAIGYIGLKKRYKHYEIFVRFWRPDWQKFIEILKVGMPIGLTVMSEVGLFSAAYFLMGMLSTQETAAHAIALQITSVSFMVPFGLSFATTVRVGLAYGEKNKQGVFYAGWVSIIMAFLFMLMTCSLFLIIPEIFVYLFLDPKIATNITVIGFAVSYLAIAGVFQLVDGVQVICAASLRGLSDTKVPMFVAMFGYWLFALPIAYFLAFNFGLRGQGVWIGLASGLAFVAVILLIRFNRLEKTILA